MRQNAFTIFLMLTGTCLVAEAATNSPCLTPLRAEMYHEGWVGLNKNGVREPYENSSLDVAARNHAGASGQFEPLF